jgi:uncharacterized protein (TIGR03086 family)
MTLTEDAGVTTLRTLVRHSSKEHRDGHVQSGMEGGMQVTFNRLDDLLEIADTTAERFRRIAGTFGDRVAEMPADSWAAPAPCDGWTALDVVRHLVDWVPSMIGRAGIEFPHEPGVDVDPLGAWTNLADSLQAALDDPEVAEREFDVGPPGIMSVEQAIGMLVVGDVLVHTWDLARAGGLDEHIDATVAAEMLAGMEPIDEMLRSSGHYGPRVDAPAGADVQTKLIAFTGRRP